ncbi:hypothetical protein [Micromonospora sp. NPDC049274]|uniref:hypothetical protein n=1 Tax=Micromonospora sp. NPDC049274 TaxID=3154829 RepID=UPI00341304B9
MAESQVIFLALGGNRARVVAEESGRVVASGGSATVVVDELAAWRAQRFAPGVRVVELARLRRRHLPVAAEQLLVHRAPRAALRAIGRGPLAKWSRRAGPAYERRVADRFHRRVFLPVYQRLWGDVSYRLMRRFVVRASGYDLLVVGDPASIPVAARLAEERHRIKNIAYGLDSAQGGAAQPA